MAGNQRLRGLPARPTFLSYTPNGRKLITVGLNNAIRIFQTGSVEEPHNIDNAQDSNTAVAAANDFFVTGSEDGTVCKYSLETNAFEDYLVRCTLPVRDIALSPDGNWAAVASDELVVKVVNTKDTARVIYLREQSRPVKHVSFDVSGSFLAVSCSDGQVYVYSLSSEEPALVKKVDGLIKAVETDAETSSKVLWHPDGRAFAAATPTRDIQVISCSDWERQRAFKSGHTGDITAAAWSPNGGLLATSGHDRKLTIWDTKTQRAIKTYDDVRATILAMVWHPTENILSYTNNDGELFIHTDFVPSEHAAILDKDLQAAPFIHDPLAETTGNARRLPVNGAKYSRSARRGTPDSLDEILGDDGMSDVDGFIEDDDGAGYVEEINGHGKRGRPADDIGLPNGKRSRGGHSTLQLRTHASFQPGSTPWRGNRRYLSLNFTGFVWTVDQDTHHTVTVEFYDREAHRDYHFTDPFLYDKACLNENGTLFSCQPSKDHPAMIYYRPHETWTTRTDWRTQLPPGEEITAISLSESYVVVTTSTDYVRIYTLFGTPFRVYRQKSSPTVTCASWRDYVMTIGNGPVGGDGTTRLLYTIENVKRDEICQSEDIVALSEGAELQSVFFSDQGDPCIYDTTGTLLILQHWRTPSQARWVPLLDTKLLSRLASGRKEETYWPVAVANNRFHCIILKGGDKYPYFPRPLLTDFEFQIPIHAPKPSTSARPHSPDAMDEDSDEATSGLTETQSLEEQFVRNALHLSLLDDLVGATRATHAQKQALARRELDVDKALLQLLAAECREGEERGMKALEIVGLMRDRSGKMLDAAAKIAARFGRDVLRGKIEELAERRLVGLDDDED
ncbi:putative chromosome segregation protein [Neofusicoccum parvum UCRNP2]|uniref:Putative chromosome segregation protein n=1 Tax=Botryosphaeria parva (strain UCR-NP2) TaxID=1287680 RepID=R1FUU3_BOTPV|nr:putative chromosome segregation protein [Neofusicoccum parvum UCRNP2]